MLQLPNLLTGLRLALTPLVAWVVATEQWLIAGVLFTIAALTDALDGWLARRLHARSSLGEMLDPLADKALINATMIGCALAGLLPLWLAVLIAGRDIIILGGSFITRSLKLGHSLLPRWIGKAATAGQMSLIALALIDTAFADVTVPGALLLAFVVVTAALTLGSGVAYGFHWLRYFSSDVPREGSR